MDNGLLHSFIDEMDKIATSKKTKAKMRRLEAEGKYKPGERINKINPWGHEGSRWTSTTGDQVRRRSLRDMAAEDPKWETRATPDKADEAAGYRKGARNVPKKGARDWSQRAARHSARARVMGNEKAQARYDRLYGRREGQIRAAEELKNSAPKTNTKLKPRKVGFLRKLLR